MKSTSRFAVAATIVALFSATAAAQNAFTQSVNNDWNRSENWTLGVPLPTHNVLIPTGLTCIISTNDDEAATVEVQTGATLGIEQVAELSIYTPDVPNPPAAMTVDGIVYLHGIDANFRAVIYLLPQAASGADQLTGSGEIVGGNVEDEPAYGTITGSVFDCLTIDTDLTLRGSLSIDLALKNNGTILVDNASFMLIGSDDPFIRAGICSGSGVFKVTHWQGQMVIANVGPQEPTTELNLEVSAGWLTLADGIGGALPLEGGAITVSGGQGLISERPLWCTDYSIDIDGANMNVFGGLTMSAAASVSTLNIDNSGRLQVFPGSWFDGVLDITDTTVTVPDGFLFTDFIDSDDSALTILAGQCEVYEAFTAQRSTGQSSVTIAGGELFVGVGLGYSATDTNFTLTAGQLDVYADFSNAGPLAYSGGTIQVAAGKTVTFSKP